MQCLFHLLKAKGTQSDGHVYVLKVIAHLVGSTKMTTKVKKSLHNFISLYMYMNKQRIEESMNALFEVFGEAGNPKYTVF